MTCDSISRGMRLFARGSHPGCSAGLARRLRTRQDRSEGLRALGNGPASGKTLSREQLRECLDLQPELKSRGEEALRSRAQLDAAKAEFDRYEAQLQGERKSLDAADQAAVDAYNAKVEKRRLMFADYTTSLPDVTGQAQKYSALRQSWEAECDDRPYREGDYQAIPRGR